MNIDERLQAVVKSLELLTHDVHSLQTSVAEIRESGKTLVESVAGLLRVAQNHENLTRLEGSAD